MVKRIRKHSKRLPSFKKLRVREQLTAWTAHIPLNISDLDRISFSVKVNNERKIRRIENISYDVYVNEEWISIIRYDDHGGKGSFHKHTRISLHDNRMIESSNEVRLRGGKHRQFQWAINDIKKKYISYRKKFMKSSKLDMY